MDHGRQLLQGERLDQDRGLSPSRDPGCSHVVQPIRMLVSCSFMTISNEDQTYIIKRSEFRSTFSGTVVLRLARILNEAIEGKY